MQKESDFYLKEMRKHPAHFSLTLGFKPSIHAPGLGLVLLNPPGTCLLAGDHYRHRRISTKDKRSSCFGCVFESSDSVFLRRKFSHLYQRKQLPFTNTARKSVKHLSDFMFCTCFSFGEISTEFEERPRPFQDGGERI